MYKDYSKRLKYQKLWGKKRRDEWISKNGPCVKCGSTKNLEMDHVEPKSKDPHIKGVSHYIWTWGIDRLYIELKKCQVLCRSCHHEKTRVETFGERKHATHAMYKRGKCRCVECVSFWNGYRRELRSKKKFRGGLTGKTPLFESGNWTFDSSPRSQLEG